MALSFIFDAGKGETPQSVAQKRALVQQLMGTGAAPKTFGEGLSALGDGIVANVSGRRANEAESKGQAGANDTFSALTAMLTGKGGATPSPGFSVAPSAAGGSPGGGNSYRDAIASIESAGSGDYNAIGPTHDTLGRALGRYQVMEANIGPWSRAALGREISADEFMANPELQDAIFDHRFGSYVDQYGPQGAAQAWFAGPGGVGKMDRRDVLGTSVSAYTDKFTNAIGGAGGGQPAPVQVASLDPSIGMPQAQPAQLPPIGPSGGPQMAAAPQQPGMVPQMPPMQPRAPMAPQQPMQTAQGPSMQMLMEAAANPWLNEGQRGIVNSIIAQEMQRQDPAYQQNLRAGDLGIQKSELELAAMRNPGKKPPIEVGGVLVDPDTFQPVFDSRQPSDNGFTLSPGQQRFDAQGNPIASGQPEPGYRQLSPEEVAQSGLDGQKGWQVAPTGEIKQIGGGGVSVSVGGNNDIGTIPPGKMVTRDAQGNVTGMVDIPGGPSALEAEQAAAQAAARSEMSGRTANIVTDDITRALDLAGPWTTGFAGSIAQNIAGSPASDLNSILQPIKANISFDKLQQMREASPTGGALGSVSDNEGRLLQSVYGAVEQSQSEAQFRYNLRRLYNTYQDVIHGPDSGPRYDLSSPDSPAAAPNQSTVPASDIDALLELYK